MVFWRRFASPAVGLALSCSIDERLPDVTTEPVMTECARGTDDPRCDDGFVLRCGEAGAWQRAAARCELGCEGGACVESPTGDAGPQPSCGSDGEECDDGQYCTVGDTCDEGVCNGTPRGCDDGVA